MAKSNKKNGKPKAAAAKAKLALNAKNLGKMTPEQKRKYKKHLADVRAYVLDRREWHKAVKNHAPGTPATLAEFRARKHGTTVAQQEATTHKIQAEAEAVVANVVKTENGASKAAQLERLVAELRRAEERQTELLAKIRQEVG